MQVNACAMKNLSHDNEDYMGVKMNTLKLNELLEMLDRINSKALK